MTKYEVLQVGKFASRKEIQEAYETRMQECLIRKKDSKELQRLRKELRNAYATLIDEDKRKAYDRSLVEVVVEKEEETKSSVWINILAIVVGVVWLLPLEFLTNTFYQLLYFVIALVFIRISMQRVLKRVSRSHQKGPLVFCLFLWMNLGVLFVNQSLPLFVGLIEASFVYLLVYRYFVE